MSLLRETVREIVKRLFPQSFLSVDPGLALLDTAAAQALVGESGLKGLERQLESLDLRVVTLDVKRLANQLESVVVARCPVCFGDRFGVIEFVVLGQFSAVVAHWSLEKMGALIDVPAGTIFSRLFFYASVELSRLSR